MTHDTDNIFVAGAVGGLPILLQYMEASISSERERDYQRFSTFTFGVCVTVTDEWSPRHPPQEILLPLEA